MSRSSWRRQIFLWAVLIVVGADYLAQIPYYFDVYYFPHHVAPALSGSILLGLTFVWFLAGYIPLARGSAKGYWLLLSFLVTEVFFYAHNNFTQITHGYAPFFQLHARDAVLSIVFGIGYLNLLLGVCFLCYLARYYHDLVAPAPVTALNPR